jgi:thiol-disulfide isomerase/thioredoxin
MPKLPPIEGHIWIGQKPITLDDLADKVVLVYFWAYSSVHCRRDLQYVQMWHEKYKDEGLSIIGIHSPEFEFEVNPKNVENIVRDLDITWPVLLDNEHANWDAFENDSWPAKFLSDKEGNVVYSHFGEGEYEETEEKIRELLDIQGGGSGAENGHTHGSTCLDAMPETYCGYLRGNIANELSYTEEDVDSYESPTELREGELSLEGAFFSSPEYAESREEGAMLAISFRAAVVSLVLGFDKGEAEVEVFLDDHPIRADIKGKDVGDGGLVKVARPDAYELLKSKEPISGTLKIVARKGNFRAYTFTFSGCNEVKSP